MESGERLHSRQPCQLFDYLCVLAIEVDDIPLPRIFVMGACCSKRKKPEQAYLLGHTKYGGTTMVCVRCGQSVTSFEGKHDSGGRIYHPVCLRLALLCDHRSLTIRCGQCSRSLAGQSVTFRDGDIFCSRHALPVRSADVQSQAASELVANRLHSAWTSN